MEGLGAHGLDLRLHNPGLQEGLGRFWAVPGKFGP